MEVPVIREGLKAVKELSADGIKTNVTLNFSSLQELLAAKCGATYISPFVGRLDAIRHPEHVLQAALAGSDVCTMSSTR